MSIAWAFDEEDWFQPWAIAEDEDEPMRFHEWGSRGRIDENDDLED